MTLADPGRPKPRPCSGISAGTRLACAAVIVLPSLLIGSACGGDAQDASNGIESKPPEEVVALAAKALEGTKSFHLESTDATHGSISADVGLPQQLRLALKTKGRTASMLVAKGSFYMKGNEAFWKDSKGGAQAGEIADRWWRVPFSFAKDLAQALSPRVISRCLTTGNGTLVRGGTAMVAGRRAVVIEDKGDRPGTAPAKVYVAATGAPLPLRLVTTGKQRPGGRKHPECGDDTPAEPGDVANLSNYNAPLEVSPPPAAVDIGSAISR